MELSGRTEFSLVVNLCSQALTEISPLDKLEKPEHLASRTEFWVTGTDLCKPHESSSVSAAEIWKNVIPNYVWYAFHERI